MRTISVLIGVALLASCGPDSERLRCEDLLPAGAATYSDVAALVVNDSPKSCGGCHNTASPVYGLNFEGRAVAYDALTTKMHLIYPQVASGLMPKVGEPWSADDLRVLRSWYCDGAFYERANE